jgi:hypothetical protein
MFVLFVHDHEFASSAGIIFCKIAWHAEFFLFFYSCTYYFLLSVKHPGLGVLALVKYAEVLWNLWIFSDRLSIVWYVMDKNEIDLL